MKALPIIAVLALSSCMKARYVTASVTDCRTGQTDTIRFKAYGGLCLEYRENDTVLVDHLETEIRFRTCDYTVLKIERRRK